MIAAAYLHVLAKFPSAIAAASLSVSVPPALSSAT